ncbi:hypothetical protein ACRPOS_007285 [Bartonella heixiaziensis]|uniref:hypothetical protein n=1 Tax=Bartonella heixiaziensis TaxID=1461000 RepID=UPI0039089DC5
MKWENSAFYNKLRYLFFGQELFSFRECIVIYFLSLIVELCNRILFLPRLAEWKLSVWQDTTFSSIFVLWEVITVCVVAFIPVMLILYIILWCLLRKNTWKLKEINQQRGEITRHQKDPDKKNDRGNMYEILIVLFALVLTFVTIWIAIIPMVVLELYYGVFKQVRMYCCLRKELKTALKEYDIAFEKS